MITMSEARELIYWGVLEEEEKERLEKQLDQTL